MDAVRVGAAKLGKPRLGARAPTAAYADRRMLIQECLRAATLETPEGPRFLAAAASRSQQHARFAILGRENCDTRYYETTLFTRIGARDRDGLVVDFEDRDFLETGVAPRQLTPTTSEGEAPAAPRRGLDPPSAPTQNRE